LTPLLAFGLGWLAHMLVGYSNYKIPSIAWIAKETVATVFRDNEQEDKEGLRVSIESLAPLIASADWTDQFPINKGTWTLKINERTTLRVSYYGGFFYIDGVPGHFVVAPEHQSRFQGLLSEMKSSANRAK
jgi:hypothetical protein